MGNDVREARSLAKLIIDNETIETLRRKQHDVMRRGVHSSEAAERAIEVARMYQQEINTLIRGSAP